MSTSKRHNCIFCRRRLIFYKCIKVIRRNHYSNYSYSKPFYICSECLSKLSSMIPSLEDQIKTKGKSSTLDYE